MSNPHKIESAKYMMLGNVDSSKTSLIAVMVKNVLDDGNGSARSLITTVKHERESGRTSMHAPYYLIKGNEITTLIDLCGHEKYLKTTMFGIMGLFCDYGIVVIGANMGICGMTTEHMGLLIANKIPFIIIISKIDICPKHIMLETKKNLNRIARRNKKSIIYFEDEEKKINQSYLKDSHNAIIATFHERKVDLIPTIMISNKTGYNISFVRELITSIHSQAYLEKMNVIIPKIDPKTENYPMIMYIDSIFNITGIGIVLAGTVKYGSLHMGQKLYLGPINNTYIGIVVKSIRNCVRDPVDILRENESGSIGIRLEMKGSYSREMFSKGHIVTDNVNFALKNTCYSLSCCVAVFNHPTTIRNGYQTIIHCGTIRQVARFVLDENQTLRTNSRANIKIRFILKSEFILPSTLFMFRDGRTKGMGKILSTIPFAEDTHKIPRPKQKRLDRRQISISKK